MHLYNMYLISTYLINFITDQQSEKVYMNKWAAILHIFMNCDEPRGA